MSAYRPSHKVAALLRTHSAEPAQVPANKGVHQTTQCASKYRDQEKTCDSCSIEERRTARDEYIDHANRKQESGAAHSHERHDSTGAARDRRPKLGKCIDPPLESPPTDVTSELD